MVGSQLAVRDINDPQVLDAMRRVPRHLFVPPESQAHAYEDRPLAIGDDQTISQPYIVALMTQLAAPTTESVALDVGTGCGYQAAVLAEICGHVYSIEIIPRLADSARQRLSELGYHNVQVKCGDANCGWPEHAPFDVIIAAAAPIQVPRSLTDQLKTGGRLVLPVGGRGRQELFVIEKHADGSLHRTNCGGVSFVPMTGRT